MPRDVPIGNGAMLIAFDKDSMIREFHFPLVGEENHAGQPFRIGLWMNNQFFWLHNFPHHRDYNGDTLVTKIEWSHPDVKITSNDTVDFTENLYLKKLSIKSKTYCEIKLFFAHNFSILGNEIGDTAAYMPEQLSLLHYKQDRYFLINALANGKFGIDDFATGNPDTWKDAEDGHLSQNPIAQGSVGSVFAIPLTLTPEKEEICYYWIAVGKHWDEVKNLNHFVQKTTPFEFFRRTSDYWASWVDKEHLNYKLLPPKIARAYKRSLLICSTQTNNCGSIIAGNDSDVIQFNRDTYSYMWPRDGSLVAYGLILAGYETAPFFKFCAKLIEDGGYFLHKYSPSGSLGSSWHPWSNGRKSQLPIQEDETALVIWALWQHYLENRDLELIRPLYLPLIRKAADFLMNYRDLHTGLPLPSYDLWEERRGILTFTTSTVIGGLQAASSFANAFGETSLAKEYADGANKMVDAMSRYLYLPEKKRFARMIQYKMDGSVEVDATIDASLYAVFAFGAFDVEDEKVKNTMDQIMSALKVSGGIIRYENDLFFRRKEGVSNPWLVATLWTAQYLIAKAKTKDELDEALKIFEWVADRALPSGVLAEQIDPETQEPVSVSPLTWSHGTFIAAIQEYLNKMMKIEICPHCGMPKVMKKLLN